MTSTKLLLIRHAERPKIADNQVGNEVELTLKGMEASYNFGQHFLDDIVEIKTSPVLRCKQTASQIAKAGNYDIQKIVESQLLGDPGFFITDGSLAWQQWEKHGADRVNLHLLAGDEVWPGFREFGEAVDLMEEAMVDSLSKMDGTLIWVTHDTILATLASRCLPERLTIEKWPDFLGCLVVSLDEAHSLSYRYYQYPSDLMF